MIRALAILRGEPAANLAQLPEMGYTESQKVGQGGVEVNQILHSGRLRAKQTAELFARHLMPPEGVLEQKGLGPLDDPQEAKRLIEQAEKPFMLVGHLPHLSRLASLLILGDPEKEVVRFSMGGVVCLGRKDEGWAIGWALVPQLARQRGEPGNRST